MIYEGYIAGQERCVNNRNTVVQTSFVTSLPMAYSINRSSLSYPPIHELSERGSQDRTSGRME